MAPKVALGLTLFTSTILAVTAHHGGKMRHGENPGEMPYHEYLPTGMVPGAKEADDAYQYYHGDEEQQPPVEQHSADDGHGH